MINPIDDEEQHGGGKAVCRERRTSSYGHGLIWINSFTSITMHAIWMLLCAFYGLEEKVFIKKKSKAKGPTIQLISITDCTIESTAAWMATRLTARQSVVSGS
jgi:hypothetical protein